MANEVRQLLKRAHRAKHHSGYVTGSNAVSFLLSSAINRQIINVVCFLLILEAVCIFLVAQLLINRIQAQLISLKYSRKDSLERTY
jgi:hypothetical protein